MVGEIGENLEEMVVGVVEEGVGDVILFVDDFIEVGCVWIVGDDLLECIEGFVVFVLSEVEFGGMVECFGSVD